VVRTGTAKGRGFTCSLELMQNPHKRLINFSFLLNSSSVFLPETEAESLTHSSESESVLRDSLKNILVFF
jgi:hypothetical protein